MSKIVIHRSDNRISKFRKFRIYVDAQKIGTINNGQSEEFQLTPGQHKINLKIDFLGTSKLRFEIGENETKTFHVEYAKNQELVYIIPLGIFFVYSILEPIASSTYSVLFLVVGLLIYTYYLIKKRDKSLTLKEI